MAQARHNQTLASLIKTTQPGYCDWAAIVLFYSALHLVEAYLANMGEHPEGHADRSRALEEHGILHPIWADYRILKDYSEDARYRCVAFAVDDIDSLERVEFKNIQDCISGLLS